MRIKWNRQGKGLRKVPAQSNHLGVFHEDDSDMIMQNKRHGDCHSEHKSYNRIPVSDFISPSSKLTLSGGISQAYVHRKQSRRLSRRHSTLQRPNFWLTVKETKMHDKLVERWQTQSLPFNSTSESMEPRRQEWRLGPSGTKPPSLPPPYIPKAPGIQSVVGLHEPLVFSPGSSLPKVPVRISEAELLQE